MYTIMCLYMYIYIYMNLYVYKYVCICKCTCTYVYVHASAFTYITLDSLAKTARPPPPAMPSPAGPVALRGLTTAVYRVPFKGAFNGLIEVRFRADRRYLEVSGT